MHTTRANGLHIKYCVRYAGSDNNPFHYFDAKVLTAMLNEHLDLTTQELMLRLKRDWKADMANYDLIIKQIRMMGQGFADGIIKQFPNKF